MADRDGLIRIKNSMLGYKGEGYALAAHANDEIVALRYFKDLFDANDRAQMENDLTIRYVPHTFALGLIMQREDISPIVTELESLGALLVGRVVNFKFLPLGGHLLV